MYEFTGYFARPAVPQPVSLPTGAVWREIAVPFVGVGVRVGVGVVAHVAEEVVDVREVVVVGEEVVGVRDGKTSSRAERSPKTLSPFSRTGLEVAGFRRPTVPTDGARRKLGWRRTEQQRNALELTVAGKQVMLCIFLERSDLSFIGT